MVELDTVTDASIHRIRESRHAARPRITRKVEQRIRDELATGKGILKVAALVGVGSGTVQRIKHAIE
jgi:hypothetical protein